MLAAFGNGNISAYNLYLMLLIKCSFNPEMSAKLARNPSVDEAYIISLLISFAAEHKSGFKELKRNGTIKFLNATIGNPNITDKCFAVIASFYPEFLNDVSIAIFNSPNCGVKGIITLAWNVNTNENVLAAIPKEIIEMKNSFYNSKIFEAASGLSEYGDMNFVAKHKYDKIKKFIEGKRIELVR